MNYCNKVYQTSRRVTREVLVGNVGVGGKNPIRIQSMTTSNTQDVEATVSQVMKLADSGCEIARVTVQGKKEAKACEKIKNSLIQKGYTIPLVADIHFYPAAALEVVEFVDKIRINPGNYLDKRASFRSIHYADEQAYQLEIEKIREGFSSLVEKCIRLNKAMRIGVNHGSLSDRIMSRYGDTPSGMVESALEFARVCRGLNYHDFMFSMKASNPLVMIQAYRLLAAEMFNLGWDYPLHLGVTEAGIGEDGRIKSAIGTGSLLLDGLGDTIRVSLTEDPWDEIDPCRKIISCFDDYRKVINRPFEENYRDFSNIIYKKTIESKHRAYHPDGSVFLTVSEKDIIQDSFYQDIGGTVSFGEFVKKLTTVDALIIKEEIVSDLALNKIQMLKKHGVHVFDLKDKELFFADSSNEDQWIEVLKTSASFIIFNIQLFQMHKGRKFYDFLRKNDINLPLILSINYLDAFDNILIKASMEVGSLLADGIGEGISLDGPYSIHQQTSLMFNILQGCRKRSSKTEYIACPGCGRTLFGLQEVTKEIQSKTAHLPGVKIAVMGCIVNGPGEMADADFGYVGSKTNSIDLYVGKQCVEKNIPSTLACDKLIDLIKLHGRWVNPSSL